MNSSGKYTKLNVINPFHYYRVYVANMSSPGDDNSFGEHNDRRQLYRIDDTAILEVVPVDSGALAAMPAERRFPDSSTFKLMRELRAIESDHAGILRNINDKSADIAAYLQAINKKIDAMGRAIAEDLLGDNDRLQSVDLSQGGIGFNHSERLEEGSTHAAKIWFNRTFFGLATYIKVVACHRAIDGGYHISSSFIELPEADEQIIAKHIMQVQARQQRLKKLFDE